MNRRSISLLLTIAMVFSMFASVPFAAAAAEEPSGLILQYLFDGNVNDSSSSAKNGTVVDTASSRVTYTDEARFGKKAINFPGGTADNYVQIPGDALNGLTSVTVSGWMYIPSEAGGWQRFFDFGQSTTYYMFYGPKVYGSNSVLKITKSGNGSEAGVSDGTIVGSGAWHHVAVTLDAASDTITTYLDGVKDKSASAGKITLADIINTDATKNKLYIGKSQFTGDSYFGGKMYDFRIYNRSLTDTEIQAVCSSDVTDAGLAQEDLQYINIPTSDVQNDITLPTAGTKNNSAIAWSSDTPAVISDSGKVTRPAAGQPNATVKLTATATKNGTTATKEFTVTVLAALDSNAALTADKDWLTLSGINALQSNLTLPTTAPQGSTITWSSDNEAVLSSTGVVTLPSSGSVKVNLTAALKNGAATATKVFEVNVVAKRSVGAGSNVAQNATPVASYTASPSLVTNVNNGSKDSGGGASECWETWNSSANPVNIYYEWPEAITLSSTDVMWWYDQTTAANGGVPLPSSCTVQYWNGTAWADVTNMADETGTPVTSVGVKGNGTTGSNTLYNGVTFDPVTTTRIRLTITQNKTLDTSSGMGIQEWRVYSTDEATVIFSNIKFSDPQWTINNLTLPTQVNGYTISWVSKNPDVIDNTGKITSGTTAATAVLTATAAKDGKSFSKDYSFTVLPIGTAGRTIELDTANLGINISPTLYGIFFEDIDHALDGGINADLIDNGSFQQYNWPTALPSGMSDAGPNNDRYSLDPKQIYSWTALAKGNAAGSATIVDTKPMNTNNNFCVEVNVTNAGSDDVAGYGIAANGYTTQATNVQAASMQVKQGIGYDVSMYLQGSSYAGKVKVFLEDASGNLNSNILEFSNLPGSWDKYTGRLTALKTVKSRMMVMGDSVGKFYIDYVTLYPQSNELWKNGAAGGLRNDMLSALSDLQPNFMRFPGGCASEGKSKDRLYRWKDTVGPREARRQMPNYCGYWSSNEVGFYEYFCMAEQLGAEPLPVVGLGVTCHFKTGSNYYEAPIGTEGSPEREEYMKTYVQDALDLIEFCNGDVTTTWGKVRADMGHPAPFDLKYISVGNENWGTEFWKRFDLMYKAVKAKYPDIKIISTSGPYSAGGELNDNYKQIDANYADTIVDEHYYQGSDWFLKNMNRYNSTSVRGSEGHTYDRSKETRVFVGEYSDNTSSNHFLSAMDEAAYTTALERNSDMVLMAAYAPLFCKQGMYSWGSNLIWFDNGGLWKSCNYYYQKLFANNFGTSAVGDKFYTYADANAKQDVYTSPTINTDTGDVYLKIVNTDKSPKDFHIVLKNNNGKARNGSYSYITSDNIMVRNQESNDYSEAVSPITKSLGEVSDDFYITVPGYSVGAVSLINTDITDVSACNVSTEASTAPVLPSKVTVKHKDGSTAQVDVQWNSVDSASYAQKGTFSIEGTIANSSLKAIANITVTDANPSIKPFIISSNNGLLDRTDGLQATVKVDLTPGVTTHSGKEVVIFQLMKDNTPANIVALARNIAVQEEFTAYFNVNPSDTKYTVRVFVLDSFTSELTNAPISLAASATLK